MPRIRRAASNFGRRTRQARAIYERRLNRTHEQHMTDNMNLREQVANTRANESLERRTQRLTDMALRNREVQRGATAAIRENNQQRVNNHRAFLRASLLCLAFNYDPEIDYSSHSLITIGNMDKMTSFGATKVFENEDGRNFESTFKIQGQIYFMGDAERQTNMRCEFNHIQLMKERDIVNSLEIFFKNHNQLLHLFKTLSSRLENDDCAIIIRADKVPVGEHTGAYNVPTVNEVAVVIAGDLYAELAKKVSAMDFYCYRLMIRDNEENNILKCRQLFHQFMVDMYVKIESERLRFIKFNQAKLRAEEYIHLRDAVLGNVDAMNDISHIDTAYILSSSYIGSPRHMQEYIQDGMAYVRAYGRPDLFITFTCNPKWDEIKKLLMPGQTTMDRHDITERVFKQKLKSLMNLIAHHSVFGETRCWLYSVEWQERGLPRAHILLWLIDKVRSVEIDNIISAEIPDKNVYEELFDIITTNMIPSPCDTLTIMSPCMVNGKCTKHSPKSFQNDTITDIDGYPAYRQRDVDIGGQCFELRLSNGGVIDVDSRWVVPYSPLLCKTYKAHINVKLCSSVKSIKYICKYVHKGSDKAIFAIKSINENDEITRYQMGRYVSSNEAISRIFGFPIHERNPSVVHLAVHLENGQRVYFTENNILQQTLTAPKTTLTAFFKLCNRSDIAGKFVGTLLYTDTPKYFTWDEKLKDSNLISNLIPRKRDAAMISSAHKIRQLFAIILTTCFPSDASALWNTHKDPMKQIYNEALIMIEDICIQILNMSLILFGLSAPSRAAVDIMNSDAQREHQFVKTALATFVANNEILLTAEQLNAPGGTGKTFIISLILAHVRSQNNIALAIAALGIAATLLEEGRTAHSAFKLPLNVHVNPEAMCNMKKKSGMAKVLRKCELIIWDECTMAHKHSLEALDRSLKDIKNNNCLFGGCLLLLSGDFRQTLPIIPRATSADEINACIKKSYLWRQVKKLHLSVNIRVQCLNDALGSKFLQQLLDIDHEWLQERAILAATNLDVHEINLKIQQILPGYEFTFKLVDTVIDPDEIVNYPVEFLNSLDLPGMPPHKLLLKVGSPIILLRNLNASKLCNGTRLDGKHYRDGDSMIVALLSSRPLCWLSGDPRASASCTFINSVGFACSIGSSAPYCASGVNSYLSIHSLQRSEDSRLQATIGLGRLPSK
ncbi:uncharacterized protein LOC113375801 [Ctenocephalides felis]|uniref:uncharacterized protein LOC113375801 n=1 Tax=Ctenocephalides felis TaxID=7515 RepID=UPI000E6E34FA|nr:uncharacterized protein LOC113375801 [Ctenocephalides felis]